MVDVFNLAGERHHRKADRAARRAVQPDGQKFAQLHDAQNPQQHDAPLKKYLHLSLSPFCREYFVFPFILCRRGGICFSKSASHKVSLPEQVVLNAVTEANKALLPF